MSLISSLSNEKFFYLEVVEFEQGVVGQVEAAWRLFGMYVDDRSPLALSIPVHIRRQTLFKLNDAIQLHQPLFDLFTAVKTEVIRMLQYSFEAFLGSKMFHDFKGESARTQCCVYMQKAAIQELSFGLKQVEMCDKGGVRVDRLRELTRGFIHVKLGYGVMSQGKKKGKMGVVEFIKWLYGKY